MQRKFTQESKLVRSARKSEQPKESTLNAILAFAASYVPEKDDMAKTC